MNSSPIMSFLSGLRGWVLSIGRAVLLLGLAVAAIAGAEEPPPSSLRNQVELQSEIHGFTITGLERVGSAAPQDAGGDLHQVLKLLLAGYNHTVTRRADGSIKDIVILGSTADAAAKHSTRLAAQPTESPNPSLTEYRIATQRVGNQHKVKAFVAGSKQSGRWVWLLVDDQADTVILPASMISQLNLKSEELEPDWVDTGAGSAAGMQGWISVAVGKATRRDVAVTFVEDGKLTTNKVLGWSYLDAFDFMIDEMDDQLILVKE